MITKRLMPLVFLALMAAQACGATLTGLRWFDHSDYVRVVFDVSSQVAFRTSERPDNGYVDLILEGELAQGMRPRIEIASGPVLYAEQKQKTSSTLTWRVHTGPSGGIRSFSLGERPFKIVIDVYRPGIAPGSVGEVAPPQTAPAPEKVAPASLAAPEPNDRTERALPGHALAGGSQGRLATQQWQQPEPSGERGQVQVPENNPVVDLVQPRPEPVRTSKPAVAAKRTDPDTPVEPWADLKGAARLHTEVGSLLLSLGEVRPALDHLEAADSISSNQAGVQLLSGIAWSQLGDEYRCRLNLEKARRDERYRARADEILARMQAPDPKGLVPGGEIRTEDLEYYLNILRRGNRLDYADLNAPVMVEPQGNPGFGLGLTLGVLLAGLGGLAGYVIQRRKDADQRRRQILKASQKTPAQAMKPVIAAPTGREDEAAGPAREPRQTAPAATPTAAPTAAPAAAPSVTDAPRPVPAAKVMRDEEDNEVYQQVQAELERHLEKHTAPLTPESLAGFDDAPATTTEPAPARQTRSAPAQAAAQPDPEPVVDVLEEPDLNEQVYQMADANRPIVEIAEELELGEDEVKLILDLRPQLPDA